MTYTPTSIRTREKFTFTINSLVVSNVILAKRYSQCVTSVHPDYQDYKEPFTVVCALIFVFNFHCFWVQLKSLQSTSGSQSKPICRNLKFRTQLLLLSELFKMSTTPCGLSWFRWRQTADVPGWELLQSICPNPPPPQTLCSLLNFFFTNCKFLTKEILFFLLLQWRWYLVEMYNSCNFNNRNRQLPSSFVLHIIISFHYAFYIHIARNVAAPIFTTADSQA